MAKAVATCTCATCGAPFEATKICRNRADADSWQSWAEHHYDECWECRKARQERERQEQNAAAAAEAKERGLPDLAGSEKQTAWANSIRKTALENVDAKLGKKLDPNSAESMALYGRFLSWLESQNSAAWWIDRRENFDNIVVMEKVYNEFKNEQEEHKK